MKIIDYIESTDLEKKTELVKATMLCFFLHKEEAMEQFSMATISQTMLKSGFNAPNTARLKEKLTKGQGKAFLIVKGKNGVLEFIPAVLQNLERNFGCFWEDFTSIESESELIDEAKFCGQRNYLDKLIKQINHSYANNCFDAAAVLMRRLFEMLLILTYQYQGIDEEIKNSSGGGYLMLEKIVINAKNNRTLKLSRNRNEYDTFRKVGNFSAHNITYTASKKDIDNIKLNYRVMLEELYNKAGLEI